jgi:hypothetical protein
MEQSERTDLGQLYPHVKSWSLPNIVYEGFKGKFRQLHFGKD